MADPMYRQIADDLRRKIESGELQPGAQLPTELELREDYQNASRNTVRDAIKVLTSAGLVKTQPGRGTFVLEKLETLVVDLTPELEHRVPGPSENVEYASAYLPTPSSTRRQPSSSEPSVQVHVADPTIAEILHIEPGEQTVSRHQEKYVDRVPFSLQTTFYPYSYVERGARRLIEAKAIREGTVPYLEDLLGFQEVAYEDRLTVRPANEYESRFFRIESAVLIVEIGRVSFNDQRMPIRHTVTVYPSDRNQFIIRAGDVPMAGE